MRPWLAVERTLEGLNALAAARGLTTESGKPVRFVPPAAQDLYYELKVYETGRVETRPDSLHDFFNALAWLAFPRTKARINAMHAAEIPREGARRGRLRDLLTILDEGGALVQCDDPALITLVRELRWKELFWENRGRIRKAMRFVVVGHAVLEKALAPWPGIACKVVIAPAGGDPDAQLHDWLAGLGREATPRELPPVPIFGYPGWYPGSERAEFYDDARYFRPYGNAGKRVA